MSTPRWTARVAGGAAALLAWACLDAPAAWAEGDKRNEDEMFSEGDEVEAPAKGAAPANAAPLARAATASGATGGDAEPEGSELGDARMTGAARENTELLTRDRTQIGGFFYLRTMGSLAQDQRLSDAALGNSTLFDTYLDSRVNDRVRAYARGRLTYNPLANAGGASTAGGGQSGLGGLGMANPSTDEVRASLTQLWLKFDIDRKVFITAGRQFVRWGATRFWNPVDVLNTTRFNPLLFFDDRVGPTMIKAHVPIESLGWNLYAILLAEDAARLEQLGAALRAEAVIGQVELGVSTVAHKGQDPKIGVDISAGIWDFDLTGEAALWFPHGQDPTWQASLGLSWTWAYGEDDTLTLGAEYFHNPSGVNADAVVKRFVDYAVASAAGTAATPPAFMPMYTGQDYVGALAAVMSPGSWSDGMITALTLWNLTDHSGTAQLNLSTRVLTDLTIELYAGGSFGDGEFRGYVPKLKQAFAPMAALVPGGQAMLDSFKAPTWRGGLNFRVDL